MATKINKDQLGPLQIGDEDVNEISLSKVGSSGAVDGQVPAWNESQGEWTPMSIPDGMKFIDGETPDGPVNNVNTDFTLEYVPHPVTSVQLFRGGVLLKQGLSYDYVIRDNEITFAEPPQINDVIVAYYRT